MITIHPYVNVRVNTLDNFPVIPFGAFGAEILFAAGYHKVKTKFKEVEITVGKCYLINS
ncbi:hypothetical protein GCM10026983_28460 [Gracilibacillus alcaliphilus]